MLITLLLAACSPRVVPAPITPDPVEEAPPTEEWPGLPGSLDFDGTCPGDPVPYEIVGQGPSSWSTSEETDMMRTALLRTPEEAQAWAEAYGHAGVKLDIERFADRSFVGVWRLGSGGDVATIVIDCLYQVGDGQLGLINHTLHEPFDGNTLTWLVIAVDPMWTTLAEAWWTTGEQPDSGG